MSSNDEIKEDKYLNKQPNLADYNSSSFSFDDEEEEKSATYGKSHNFVSDDVVQEDDLPGDVNVSVTPYSQQELPYTNQENNVYASKRLSSEFDQELELLENEVNVSVTPYSQQELPYTNQENNNVYASKRLSSEFDQELELLENEVESEAKSYVEKMENEEKNYATVEKAENEEIEKYEAEKKIEEDQKHSPPPQTPPPTLVISTPKENQQKVSETPTLNNLKIEDTQATKTPQLQTQQSTDACEQKLFEQIKSKKTVANLVAKFNAVATTSDEKSGGQNGVNAKLKQDISGASIKINELRQRFNDDK
uniref:Uncharacterized protein n=1 Tax=Meloidogyne floridensis TaxID=298350 RepID=A0A915P7P7_9BILA